MELRVEGRSLDPEDKLRDVRIFLIRFNKLLTQALTPMPKVLMLDEPTNHLDSSNRRSLMHMLAAFHGTLIMVTHDVE